MSQKFIPVAVKNFGAGLVSAPMNFYESNQYFMSQIKIFDPF